MKTEYILSFLTICIGAFVAWIGCQQYRVNRERFKLDLFERRFSVYKGVQVFLTHIQRNGNFKLEQLFDFRADTQDSVFLFDEDITNYIGSIDKKALGLGCLHDQLEDMPVGPDRSKKCEEMALVFAWLDDQLPQLKVVFLPYLKFKTWK